MPNLKDIRRRIKSVKSTEKITLAMKMVAAAKVKKAENRLKANQPYSKTLGNLFAKVYDKLQQASASGEIESSSKIIELLKPRDVQKVGVVVIASDRGLCGSYSSSIIKQAVKLDKLYRQHNLEPIYYLVGNKIIRTFPYFCPQAKIIGNLGGITASPSHHDARQIMETMLAAFHQHQIDAMQLLFTRFMSMISYKVSLAPLLPTHPVIDLPELPLIHFSTIQHSNDSDKKVLEPELQIEPNPQELLETLIPTYLENQTYAALLESSASELAARMTAMSNASKNATELIAGLTLEYNKARQAAITQEILEIVGGANAV